jgi:hypothetical protein
MLEKLEKITFLVHDIKTYSGVEVEIQLFLISALERDLSSCASSSTSV